MVDLKLVEGGQPTLLGDRVLMTRDVALVVLATMTVSRMAGLMAGVIFAVVFGGWAVIEWKFGR